MNGRKNCAMTSGNVTTRVSNSGWLENKRCKTVKWS